MAARGEPKHSSRLPLPIPGMGTCLYQVAGAWRRRRLHCLVVDGRLLQGSADSRVEGWGVQTGV